MSRESMTESVLAYEKARYEQWENEMEEADEAYCEELKKKSEAALEAAGLMSPFDVADAMVTMTLQRINGRDTNPPQTEAFLLGCRLIAEAIRELKS